jgi:GTP-binding protein HflX
VPEFLQRLSGMMLERTRRMKLRLPQSEFGIMSLIHQQGKVITQNYDGNDILLDIIVPRRFDAQLEPYLDPPLPARIPEAWEASGR